MSEAFDFSTPEPSKKAPTVFPRFYLRPLQNNFRSEREGRPIFEDFEYIEITVAGDTRTTVDRRVKDEDRQRWADSYRAFKAGAEQATTGTPLEAWPALTPAMVMEYKAMHIKTVEALAELPDSALNNLGTGGRLIRDKAKAWLERADSDAPLAAAIADKADLEAQRSVDAATIAAQAQEIERLKSKIVEQS